jgi:hypothetical protein
MKNYSHLYALIQQIPCFPCALLYPCWCWVYRLIQLGSELASVPVVLCMAVRFPRAVSIPRHRSRNSCFAWLIPVIAGITSIKLQA